MSAPRQPPRAYQREPRVEVPVLDLERDFVLDSQAARPGPLSSLAEDVKDSPATKQEAQSEKPEPPFHIFNKKQTWCVVIMIGIAGMFSGLSSNIYFPSLDAISKVKLSALVRYGLD